MTAGRPPVAGVVEVSATAVPPDATVVAATATVAADPTSTARPPAWTHEVVRKVIHLGMVALPAWIWWAPETWRSPGLLLALLVVLTADVLRRVWMPWARWIEGWSRPYRRPRERRLWVGVHAMFLSAWLLSWTVSPQQAVLCLCYGVFGDAAAAVFGRRFDPTHGKTARGSMACFLTCCVVGFVLLPQEPLRILLGSGVATLFERVSGPIDDNLTIPVGTAIVLSLLS